MGVKATTPKGKTMITSEWLEAHSEYPAYVEAAIRCDEVFHPVTETTEADRTDEFLEAVHEEAMALQARPDRYAKPGIKELAGRIKSGETMTIAGIERASVRLDDDELIRLGIQIGLMAPCW